MISRIIDALKALIKGQPFKKNCSFFLWQYLNETIKKELIFLQIGANDGADQDKSEIVKSNRKMTSVLVEPQKEIYDRLVKNHRANQNIYCVNVAVGPESGEKEFFKLNISSSRWASGLSSFSLETIKKHYENGYIRKMAEREGLIIDNFNDIVDSEMISVKTIPSIMDNLRLDYPNIIFIDAEGFDYEIFKSIDLNEPNLDILLMEFIHLAEAKFKKTVKLLNQHNFKVYLDGRDLFAIRNSKKNG